MDNIFRGIRELHIWCCPWTSTVMSSRLDCFLSLSICHFVVTSFLFAGTLSFASPKTFYKPPIHTVSFIVLVVLIVTILASLFQLVSRMARLGDGFKLSGYRAAGVLMQPHRGFGQRQSSSTVPSRQQNNVANAQPPTVSIFYGHVFNEQISVRQSQATTDNWRIAARSRTEI